MRQLIGVFRILKTFFNLLKLLILNVLQHMINPNHCTNRTDSKVININFQLRPLIRDVENTWPTISPNDSQKLDDLMEIAVDDGIESKFIKLGNWLFDPELGWATSAKRR